MPRLRCHFWRCWSGIFYGLHEPLFKEDADGFADERPVEKVFKTDFVYYLSDDDIAEIIEEAQEN